jgi:hypothetical protein
MALSKIDGTNFIEGTVPSTVAPGAGKVLQVSNMAIITSAQNIASSTYVDLTGFSINITPSSTSNKIFMCANISSLIGATGRGYGLKFLRDSTVVYDSNALYVHYPQSAGFRSMTTWNFIDSPSSTSEITYKIQVGTQSAAEVSFQEGSIKSTFYLMEIAG